MDLGMPGQGCLHEAQNAVIPHIYSGLLRTKPDHCNACHKRQHEDIDAELVYMVAHSILCSYSMTKSSDATSDSVE